MDAVAACRGAVQGGETEAPAEWQRFESLLVDLSAAFVNIPAHRVDGEITCWLERIVRFLDVDRSTLFQLTRENETFRVTHSWAAAGYSRARDITSQDWYPWVESTVRRGETVVMTQVDDLPAEARKDQETFRELGVKALVCAPLTVAGTAIGALAFVAVRGERVWPEALVKRLQLVGQVFTNVSFPNIRIIGNDRSRVRQDEHSVYLDTSVVSARVDDRLPERRRATDCLLGAPGRL